MHLPEGVIIDEVIEGLLDPHRKVVIHRPYKYNPRLGDDQSEGFNVIVDVDDDDASEEEQIEAMQEAHRWAVEMGYLPGPDQ